jgi:hypothetical protein
MKQFSRLAVIFALAMVMVLGPALSVSAQDGGNVLCNGLVAEDCQVLTDSLTSMQGVTSLALTDWGISFTGTDGTQTVSFNAAGSGEVVFPTDEAGTGMALHLMIDNYSVVDTDGTEQTGALELLMVDNMTYIQKDGTWYGETLDEGNASQIAGAIMELTQIQSGLGELAAGAGTDVTGVVTTTSAPGSDGGTAFVSTADVTALLSALLMSPAGMEMLGSEMGGDMSSMTPADMQMMAQMFAPMLQGTSIQLTTNVGADNMLSGTLVDVVFAADVSAFVPDMTPISAEFHFSANYGQYNEAFTFEAPAEYQPSSELDLSVPGADVLGGITGGM